jgi:hypothetical protein
LTKQTTINSAASGKQESKTNMRTNQTTMKVSQKLTSACQRLVNQIAWTKINLVSEFKKTLGVQERVIQLAVNEAEALAWETDYPHLVFPSLALEKINGAAVWQQRQQLIRRPNAVYAFAA